MKLFIKLNKNPDGTITPTKSFAVITLKSDFTREVQEYSCSLRVIEMGDSIHLRGEPEERTDYKSEKK